MWRTETPEWIEGTKIAQDDPHMIVGTSDGGAHLDRDDGAEAHTWFLQHWVREWGGFTLEEGVRQITAIPAALCGLVDRGVRAARLRRRPLRLRPRHRRPRPEVRSPTTSPTAPAAGRRKPKGVQATIVNGVPIVIDGELQADAGLPGQVLAPGVSS